MLLSSPSKLHWCKCNTPLHTRIGLPVHRLIAFILYFPCKVPEYLILWGWADRDRHLQSFTAAFPTHIPNSFFLLFLCLCNTALRPKEGLFIWGGMKAMFVSLIRELTIYCCLVCGGEGRQWKAFPFLFSPKAELWLEFFCVKSHPLVVNRGNTSRFRLDQLACFRSFNPVTLTRLRMLIFIFMF